MEQLLSKEAKGKKEECIKQNKELYHLLLANSIQEKTAWRYLQKCIADNALYQFYLKNLNPNFYRNKCLSFAIRQGNDLIEIPKINASLLTKINKEHDKELANYNLNFIHLSTNTDIRNYYRNSIMDEFHKILKNEFPNLKAEIIGRVKSFISYLAKTLLLEDLDSISDIFGFRVILWDNGTETETELMTTLAKICVRFIKFCQDDLGITIIPAQKLKSSGKFNSKKHPDVVLPNEEFKEILAPYADYIKDYISSPKEDGYQSIHVVIYTIYGKVEIQFRTKVMDVYAEEGLASHSEYKDKPEYNFLMGLANKANSNSKKNDFIGLTKSDNIYYKKLRHPVKAQENCPRTCNELDLSIIDIGSIMGDSPTIF